MISLCTISVTKEVTVLKDKLDNAHARLVESDQTSLKAAKIATEIVEMKSKLDEALTEKRMYKEKMQLLETLTEEKNNTVDCQWTAWSPIIKTCGVVMRSRKVHTEASNGGKECYGNKTEEIILDPCPGNFMIIYLTSGIYVIHIKIIFFSLL